MKIAVVGCGALGSFYGAKLLRGGQDVHFLLRSDYEIVRKRGLDIESPEGDFHCRPMCARQPGEIGIADLVLIGLKTTANDQFGRLLPDLIGPGTLLLTLQNGLGNEEDLAELYGGDRVLGGLCFVCLNRVAPGRVRHMGHGRIELGEYGREPEARTSGLAGMFRDAGVVCDVVSNLEQAHWEKLVWNVPFNGLGVAGAAGYEAVCSGVVPARRRLGSVLTTDRLLSEPRWFELVRGLMLEVIGTARALGFKTVDRFADIQIERTRTMGAYKASTLLDFERGQALELESLFLRPWRQAQEAGVSTPRLAALCSVLETLDKRRL